MMELTLQRIKTPKALTQGLFFLIAFIVLYTIIDINNLSYPAMAQSYGMGLVIMNIVVNIIMASMSSLMLMLSAANAELKGKESVGSNLSFASVLFGILTYGCTPCVIAFFSTIGIAFSVAVLPLAGFPYKLLSVLLLIIGLLWTRHEILHGKCKVTYENH